MKQLPLPRLIVYAAVSLDGKTTGFDADVGLYYELAATWKEDASLCGSDTMVAASAEEANSGDSGEPAKASSSAPLLVVPDSRGRVKAWRYLLSLPYWRDAVVLCSSAIPARYLSELADLGIETIIAGNDHVDYRSALAQLRERFGVETIRVDSGGRLSGLLLREGLVDEVSVLVFPTLVGNASSLSIYNLPETVPAGDVVSLALRGVEVPRDDAVWLRYDVVH
ncbi:MAG TPA: dihydrofolate reductase family protein [Gaiellaceae bacterium]|jgi:2,5-diamino-6-(ribosylamino)-4(3H)-pyrimidinone 5'-phosphate reductase